MEKNIDSVSTAATTDALPPAAPAAAPVSAPEKDKKDRAPVIVFGMQMPGFISQPVHAIGDWTAGVRKKAIQVTPSFIVNGSSNLLGALQLVGEVMMFKASAKEPLVSNWSDPRSIAEAPVKIVKEIFGGATRSDLKVGELLKGNPAKNIYHRITHLEDATAREVTGQIKADPTKSVHTIRLPNRWQTRSTALGIVGWGLNMLIPEKKEKDEDVQKMAEMSAKNPVAYGLECVRRAVWLPDWGANKRYMTGLFVMGSGMCSTLGAWRNREKLASGLQHYRFNPSYMMTGLLTLAGGIGTLLAVDNARGYGAFGSTLMLRTAFLPTSIYKKFQIKEDGRHWYTSAVATFQTQNALAVLFGGAEKRPDGTIIDHKTAVKEGKKEGREERKHRAMKAAEPVDEKPSSTISQAEHVSQTTQNEVAYG